MTSQIIQHLLDRERELQRARTRGLARAQWADVIEIESKLEELARLRAWIVNLVTQAAKTEADIAQHQ